MKKMKFPMFVLLAILLVQISCSNDDDKNNSAAVPSVQLENNLDLGDYLVDANGKTLYFFGKDVTGTSFCEGGCLDAWPAFNGENDLVADGLEEADFGSITRADGSLQTTYKGWPLYYFNGDEQPGEINGDGNANNLFQVAKPDYSVMIAQQVIAEQTTNYLVDDRGYTLYTFVNDTPETSECNNGCLSAWPIFTADIDELIIPSNLNMSSFGTFSRENNTIQQLTFLNKQLYFFVNDEAPGDLNGLNNPNFLVIGTLSL